MPPGTPAVPVGTEPVREIVTGMIYSTTAVSPNYRRCIYGAAEGRVVVSEDRVATLGGIAICRVLKFHNLNDPTAPVARYWFAGIRVGIVSEADETNEVRLPRCRQWFAE